jgi:hypothetical protein
LTGFNLIGNGIILRPTSINRALNGRERMLQRLKRKRGGQAGNVNAMRHGRYSPRLRAAAVEARREEERERERAWTESCPKTDYGKILDELDRLRREKEAAIAGPAGARTSRRREVSAAKADCTPTPE